MKSYNHLWEEFISDRNIEKSIKDASRGKMDRNSVKRKLANPRFKENVRAYALNFFIKYHVPKQIYDGVQRKIRTIIVPSFEEQVVHHMLINVLKPIIMKGMYYHSYASIPKRGSHKGKKAIERFIRNNSKQCRYVLKMDIQKYFDSIPHETILELFNKKIHDKKILSLMEEIINATPVGIPLGFYTSQWFSNWYLQGLDHYIKEQLHAPFYVRYMDDMVIFCSNKRKLHEMRKAIEQYLNELLGLKLKGNWQVFKFDYNGKYRFLDFMGFRFYRNRTTLRRSIMLKASRKARRIAKKDKITVYESRQMLSYLGWIKDTNTYGMYVAWIKPYVSFQKLKRKIKRHDRNENRRKKNELAQMREYGVS